MAIRQATQHDLIRELRKEQPKIVVFSSDWLGLPFWDGIANEVRHYDVSRYLLDHYHPLLHSHGFLVFARNGAQTPPLSEVTSKLEEPAQTTDLYFRTFPCDWGYTPDFLTIHPQSESGAVTLRPENGVLRVPTSLAPRYGWLEVKGTSKFRQTIFELSDRSAANVDERRTIRFRTRGGTDTCARTGWLVQPVARLPKPHALPPHGSAPADPFRAPAALSYLRADSVGSE